MTTGATNLALLCRRHHWMAHEGGWSVVRTRDGLRPVPALPYPSLPQARAPDPLPAA
ncbi:MAG: hypothetical protein ACLQGJ_02980 [Candidatus Dormibacteria bacterium]